MPAHLALFRRLAIRLTDGSSQRRHPPRRYPPGCRTGFATMYLPLWTKAPGSLTDILVVVGRPQQTRRPGCIAVGFVGIDGAVTVRIDEPVRVSGRVVGDSRASGVRARTPGWRAAVLRATSRSHPRRLLRRVTVPVTRRHADVFDEVIPWWQVAQTLISGAQHVRRVAVRAGFVPCPARAGSARVFLAVVLVSALRFGAEERRARREVVYVAEGQLLRHLVVTHAEPA